MAMDETYPQSFCPNAWTLKTQGANAFENQVYMENRT